MKVNTFLNSVTQTQSANKIFITKLSQHYEHLTICCCCRVFLICVWHWSSLRFRTTSGFFSRSLFCLCNTTL